MAESVVAAFSKGDIAVTVVQQKSVTPVGAYDTVSWYYECRATRAGLVADLSKVTSEPIPQTYRDAIAYGRKVFGLMKRGTPVEVA